MDLSKRSTFDLQEMLNTPMSPFQRRAVQAELDRRSTPGGLADGLDGAATAITPDPEVVDPRRKAFEQAQIEAGFTPQEAATLATHEATSPTAFNPAGYATPEAKARDRAAAADYGRRKARWDAFDREQGDARGHFDPPPMPTTFVRGPNGIPNFAPGSTTMVDGVEVPEYDLGDGKPRYFHGDVRRAQEAHREEMRPWGSHGVPGPRNDDGSLTALPPAITTPEEGRAYYTRPVDRETGKLLPSPADRARWLRGEAPVYDEDSGEIVYRMIAPQEDQGPPTQVPADQGPSRDQESETVGTQRSPDEPAAPEAPAHALPWHRGLSITRNGAVAPAAPEAPADALPWLLRELPGRPPAAAQAEPEAPAAPAAPAAAAAGVPTWHEELGLRVAPYHERQNRSSLGEDLQDGSTARVPTYERKMANGPLGPVEILVPTAATRQDWQRRSDDDKIRRIAAATGVSIPLAMPREMQQAMNLPGAAPADGEAPAANNAPAGEMTIDDLRVLNGSKGQLSRFYLDQMARQKAERKRRYSEKVRLAGGSQNLNSRNQGFFSALVDMPPEERQRVMAQMMPMDPTRATVEAHNAQNAMRLLNNIGGAAGLREILGGNDPLDRDFKRAQLDALRQQIKDAQDTADAKGKAVDVADARQATDDRAAMMEWLENHVSANYANPRSRMNYPNRHIWGLWDTTDYTVDEQEDTKTAFRARYPRVSEDDLDEMMRSVKATRNSH